MSLKETEVALTSTTDQKMADTMTLQVGALFSVLDLYHATIKTTLLSLIFVSYQYNKH